VLEVPRFCRIALTNLTEVMITNVFGDTHVGITRFGATMTRPRLTARRPSCQPSRQPDGRRASGA